MEGELLLGNLCKNRYLQHPAIFSKIDTEDLAR
jgi:hypothetical protein